MENEQTTHLKTSAEEYLHPVGPSDGFYKSLVENSLGLICAHDLNGRLVLINPQAARSLEYTADELIGRDIRDLLDPSVRSLFPRYLRQIRRNGFASGELRLVKRTGDIVTWTFRNNVHQSSECSPVVIGHALDITHHLVLEEKLKESTEQYRALFEDAPVAYHEIDHRGIMVRVNKAECNLLGWDKTDLLGRPVWELISSGQKETSKIHVKRKLSGEQALVPFVREYIRKDGEKLTLLIHESLIRSSSEEIQGIRSTLLDVTEQTLAESELRRMNAELDSRIAQRTEDLNYSNEKLSEFVHMVSHDLQEPLRSISAFSRLLLQRYRQSLDGDGVSLLNHVVEASARMSTLVQDLLSYSRTTGSDIHLSEIRLNEAVDAALENLREALERNGASVNCGDLPSVRANFTHMMQLFQNLIDNALKHRSNEPPVIKITATEQGSISVSDNGVGVPPAERQRVFGLFKRASTVESPGSGMGLAICQAIVKRHNGRIWIEEDVDVGTTFSFTIGGQ